MADYYLCRNCEVRLTRLPERRTVYDLGPCSNCGATDWTAIVELAGTASAASSASATLTITPEFPKGQVISVGPAVEHETAHPVTITMEIADSVGITDDVDSNLSPGFEPIVAPEDLPREVIAEALSLNVSILWPIDGKWPIDVEGYGRIGFAAVDTREEAALAVAIYLDGLMERWEERHRADDADRRNPDEPAQ
jgi:hypothetical protein